MVIGQRTDHDGFKYLPAWSGLAFPGFPPPAPLPPAFAPCHLFGSNAMDAVGCLSLAAFLSTSAELKICAAAVPSHKPNLRRGPLQITVHRMQVQPRYHKT